MLSHHAGANELRSDPVDPHRPRAALRAQAARRVADPHRRRLRQPVGEPLVPADHSSRGARAARARAARATRVGGRLRAVPDHGAAEPRRAAAAVDRGARRGGRGHRTGDAGRAQQRRRGAVDHLHQAVPRRRVHLGRRRGRRSGDDLAVQHRAQSRRPLARGHPQSPRSSARSCTATAAYGSSTFRSPWATTQASKTRRD